MSTSQARTTGGEDGPPEGEGQSPEIVVGEIVAWRFWLPAPPWRYRSPPVNPPRLFSLVYHNRWEPGEDTRGCTSLSEGGIHAYRDCSTAMRLQEEFASEYNFHHQYPAQLVGGTVYLWGAVHEHENGYRAEYASIRSICWSGAGLSRGLEEWAAIYGVHTQEM